MSASNKMWLVRRLSYGYQYTVVSTSRKLAMQEFVTKYKPEVDEEFAIKERGAAEWEACYRLKADGSIRKIADD